MRVREFLSAVGVAVLVVMIGALIGTLDPMGLDAAADRHSAAVVSRITAPFYGRTPFYAHNRPVGRDQITVVEVSDETLRQANIVWPPPRGFYTQMLDVLAPEKGRRPKAIFLDYIFLSDLRDPEGHDRFIAKLAEVTAAGKWRDQPGCRVTPAAKISCIIAAGGTPVIIGKPFPPDVCAAGQGDDVAALARLDEAAVVVPLGWPGAPDDARPVLSRDYYRGQQGGEAGCPLIDGEPAAEPAPAPEPQADAAPAEPPPPVWRGVGEYDLAPAGAMLVALCEGERRAKVHGAATGTAACHAILDDNGALTWSGPEVMSVAWGSIAKPEYLDFRSRIYPEDAPRRDVPCRKESRWRFIELGWLQASSAIGENQAATQVPCPYHPTLDYGLVRAEVLGGTDLGQEVQREYLQDHIVLVGASMVASTDWVDSVVHGRLAGVHYHAMMLDNLMEKGANVLHSPPAVFSGPLAALNLDWGELLEFAAAFLVVLMVEIGRRRLAGRERPDGRGILWIGIIFVWAGLVLTAATMITIAQHWVPVNVIGLFGLTVMDVIASFWSLEGVAWLIGAGIGGRQRLGRGITRFVFWLASGVGFLFSGFWKRLRPSQREGEAPTSVLPAEEESPNA